MTKNKMLLLNSHIMSKNKLRIKCIWIMCFLLLEALMDKRWKYCKYLQQLVFTVRSWKIIVLMFNLLTSPVFACLMWRWPPLVRVRECYSMNEMHTHTQPERLEGGVWERESVWLSVCFGHGQSPWTVPTVYSVQLNIPELPYNPNTHSEVF